MGKRIFKIFLFQLLIISLIFSYFYYNNIYKKLEDKTNIGRVVNKESIKELFGDKTNIYEEIQRALLNGDKEIYLKKALREKDIKEIFNMMEEISLKNPQVMYYKGAEYSLGKFSIFYSMDREDIKRHQNEIELIREKFIRENISEGMSDYEKVLRVHDYIILNSKYDDSLDKTGSIPPESNSSYGVLALGVGVCDAYAKSMKYILDDLGIESMIVLGKAGEDNHAWNLVNIEGDYYHIDPTWNDPVTADGSNVLRHNYFNLTDDEISRSHSWNRDKYPEANSNRYNYFNYNDLLVVGREGFENKLREDLFSRKNKSLVKILNYENIDINIDEIIKDIVAKNQNIINLKTYSYALDEGQGIIDLEFLYY